MFTPSKLTISSVFTKLREIASMTGNSVSSSCFCTLICKKTGGTVSGYILADTDSDLPTAIVQGLWVLRL